MKSKHEDTQYYECGCGTRDHTLFIHTDTDPGFSIFSIGVQLAPMHNLWGRIRAAVKYVINPHGNYSHWHATEWIDEDTHNIIRMRDQLNKFLEAKGK